MLSYPNWGTLNCLWLLHLHQVVPEILLKLAQFRLTTCGTNTDVLKCLTMCCRFAPKPTGLGELH